MSRNVFRVIFVTTVALSAALTSGHVAPTAGRAWAFVFAAAVAVVGFQFVRSHKKAGQW